MSGKYYLTKRSGITQAWYSTLESAKQVNQHNDFKSIIHVDDNGVVTTVWTRPEPLIRYVALVSHKDRVILSQTFSKRDGAVSWANSQKQFGYSGRVAKLMEVPDED